MPLVDVIFLVVLLKVSIIILLCALNVRLTLPPNILFISAAILILPTSKFVPAVPVEIVTLLPAFSAVSTRATSSRALSPEVVKLGFPMILKPVPFTSVILFGSISHSPPSPFTADASGTEVISSCFKPEVSINPPSPAV